MGYELYSVNQTFKDVVEATVNVMAPTANFTATYRPGVEAIIYGPDGVNGSGSAFAPTPGTGLKSSLIISQLDSIRRRKCKLNSLRSRMLEK